MILGRGDIGKAIEDREGYLIYANGVSNRYTLTGLSMDKEEDEIMTHARTLKMFVYISTLSIYYSDSNYTKHKLKMEKLIKTNFRNYCIFRIGNITWGTNPNTLVNHLRSDKTNIQDTFRYLINKEELNHWLGMIPREGHHEMNVTGERISIAHLVQRIEHKLI